MTSGWPRALAIALALGALVLSACNPGMEETAGIDRGGVTMPVTAQGPITGFGSIIVNGVHYDVDHAMIRIDDAPATASDLALGQLVTVVGERDDAGAVGVADTVSFLTNARGLVQSVDSAASELVVLGQRVLVTSSTVLDIDRTPPVLQSIRVGDAVSVSGFVGSTGFVYATRIESVSGGNESFLFGVVALLDAAAHRFNIGALLIDYGGANLIEGFPGGEPRDGDRVVVKGTLQSNGSLSAREVRLEEEFEHETEGSEAEVEGLITRFVSPADFDVSGRRASASQTTVYEGGSAASLAVNVKVSVHGTLSNAGVIAAEKIEVKDGGRVVDDD
jgi:hypothetical protein